MGRVVVDAGAVLARAPHAALGGDEERLVAKRVPGCTQQQHALAELQVRTREQHAIGGHVAASVADEPRALHRVRIIPGLPLGGGRKELGVREARAEAAFAELRRRFLSKKAGYAKGNEE